MMNFSLSDVLAELLRKNKMTLSKLSQNTTIPKSTLKRLMSSDTINPTISNLLPLANFFKISLDQLLGLKPIFENGNEKIDEHFVRIPIISWNQAANSRELNETNVQKHLVVPRNITLNPHIYALIVEEDDWFGFLRGSFLIVDPELAITHKDYVVVQKKSVGIPSLKQVLVDEDKIYLKPLNSNFNASLVDDSYLFFGVVIQIRHDLK